MSSLKRVANCSRYRLPGVAGVGVWQNPETGLTRFGGLQRCGSVHACPVCSPGIREQRAREVEAAGLAHIQAGGGLEFLTLTVPHGRRDALKASLGLVLGCWTSVLQSRGWRRAVVDLGLVGWVRVVEVTDGRNGWHPHVHALLMLGRPLTGGEREHLASVIAAAWSYAVSHRGWAVPSDEHGVRVQGVAGAGAAATLAAYLTKVQDENGQAHDVARELTRGDLKQGRRRASLTPFEILERAIDGDAMAVARWIEYEQATHGRRLLAWSNGLKARYAVDEVSDEVAAEAAQARGELRVTLTDAQWFLVERYRWQSRLLSRFDFGGFVDVEAFLAPLVSRYSMESAEARARPAPPPAESRDWRVRVHAGRIVDTSTGQVRPA